MWEHRDKTEFDCSYVNISTGKHQFINLIPEPNQLRISVTVRTRKKGKDDNIKTTSEQTLDWNSVVKALNINVETTEEQWSAMVIND